jgi:hypothetical protein
MFTRLLARLGALGSSSKLRNFDNRPVPIGRSVSRKISLGLTTTSTVPSGTGLSGSLPRHFVPGYDHTVPPPGQKPFAHRRASHGKVSAYVAWALRALQAKPSRPLNLPNSPFLRIIRDRSNVIHSLARLERYSKAYLSAISSRLPAPGSRLLTPDS